MNRKLRQPAVAGMFYPDNRRELEEMVKDFLERAEPKPMDGKLRGLIVPHAGYIYSGSIAAYGYKLLKGEEKRFIILGPSHQAYFVGAAVDDSDGWRTPLGEAKVDKKIVEELIKKGLHNYPQAHTPEHCLEVQLPFLQTVCKDFSFVSILTGDVDHRWLGDILSDYKDFIFIVSSDLSHYLPYEEARASDRFINEAISKLDEEKTGMGDACGKTAILTLVYIAKKLNWKVKLLDYRNSGDTAGPKTSVVGYSAFVFYE